MNRRRTISPPVRTIYRIPTFLAKIPSNGAPIPYPKVLERDGLLAVSGTGIRRARPAEVFGVRHSGARVCAGAL